MKEQYDDLTHSIFEIHRVFLKFWRNISPHDYNIFGYDLHELSVTDLEHHENILILYVPVPWKHVNHFCLWKMSFITERFLTKKTQLKNLRTISKLSKIPDRRVNTESNYYVCTGRSNTRVSITDQRSSYIFKDDWHTYPAIMKVMAGGLRNFNMAMDRKMKYKNPEVKELIETNLRFCDVLESSARDLIRHEIKVQNNIQPETELPQEGDLLICR